MLDGSGSMNGQPWNQLITALTQFINHLADNIDLKSNSWLTVITFDDSSYLQFEKRTPDKSLVSLIRQPGGGTDFNSALTRANNICKSSDNTLYDKIIFYFMSDGQSSYPTNAINQILN